MYHKIVALLGACLLLTLAACTAASVPANQTTSSPSKPLVNVPAAGPARKILEGNQGPVRLLGQGGSCLTDTNVAAYLYGWYAYEVQAPPDSFRQSAEICEHATYVCSQLLTGAGTIPEVQAVVVTNFGYHNVGAEALIKAATTVQCPHTGLTYKTGFDRTTDGFITGVYQRVSFTGPAIDPTHFGVFMKNVCSMMEPPHSPQELQPYLFPPGAGSNMFLSQLGANSDPVVLKIFVQQATLANCLSGYDNLAGYWTSA